MPPPRSPPPSRDHHTVALAHSGPGDRDGTLVPAQVALIDLACRYERLRGRGAPPRRPSSFVLVAVSGYSGEESRRRARDAQFDEFVVKPFAPQVVEALLSRRAR